MLLRKAGCYTGLSQKKPCGANHESHLRVPVPAARRHVVAQCEETLANIETVIAHADLHCASAPRALDELATRVYIRDAAHVARIRATLDPRLDAAQAICLQADICRTDLLLEMEGIAFQPKSDTP